MRDPRTRRRLKLAGLALIAAAGIAHIASRRRTPQNGRTPQT